MKRSATTRARVSTRRKPASEAQAVHFPPSLPSANDPLATPPEAVAAVWDKLDQDGRKTIKNIAGKFRPIAMTGLKKHDRKFTEAILASKRR